MFTVRRIALFAVVAVAGLVALVAVGSGGDDDRYEFRMQLANALGLREGSLITVGGVEVGKAEVDLGGGDQVEVVGKLDEGQGPIGRDARAFITSVNLLGQKRLEIVKGRVEEPAPSGTVIPADRVTESTDLDQVLAVLTPDVRARLNVLVNEAGAAVVGRDADLGKLIRTLPPTVAKATAVVDRVVGDNQTLTDLVADSDALVGDLAAERRAISGLVDSAGQAASTFAARRAQLRATLDRAPGLLATTQRFLGELERTTKPLGPAARDIRTTAPEIVAVADELAPFQKAAAPALDTAADVAPQLTRLGDGALPVLRRANPSIARLADFASELVPVTDTLDHSVHNLIGTVDNWSRAVQYRDGLSHIFRGEAAVTPQTLEGVLGRYMTLFGKKRKKAKDRGADAPEKARPADPKGEEPALKPPRTGVPKLDESLGRTLEGVGKGVDQVGKVVEGLVTGGPDRADRQDRMEPLLDFLLKP